MLISTRSSIFEEKITLSNPILCSYMLTWCEKEFNAENLGFMIEVDRLRDNILHKSNEVWTTKTYSSCDAEYGLFQQTYQKDLLKKESLDDLDNINILHEKRQSVVWPSITDKNVVEKDMNRIWEEYIKRNSASEVCLSCEVIKRTAKRMEYFNIYGPEVFSEAIEEHIITTVEVDTLPRFSNSEIYIKMFSLLSVDLNDYLEVPTPVNNILNESNESTKKILKDRRFKLDEIISDGILYSNYLKYLKGVKCEKYLLCVQLITIFEKEMNQDDEIEIDANLIENYSWEIYRNFIRKKANLEIGVCEKDRKEIMRNLARPTSTMFINLKIISYEYLEKNFEIFKQTDEYSNLNNILIGALHIDINSNINTTVPSLDEADQIKPPIKIRKKFGCLFF